MQTISKLEQYFENEVPKLITPLTRETKPEWGIMTPHQMLDHLNDTYKLSMGMFPVGEEMIHEKWEKYKTIGLNSERPIAKNFTNPIFSLLIKTDEVELDQAKQNLKDGFVSFKEFFASKDAGYTTIHNMFGRLNYHEWLWFHYKHFSHHFAQFGLIPYVERFESE